MIVNSANPIFFATKNVKSKNSKQNNSFQGQSYLRNDSFQRTSALNPSRRLNSLKTNNTSGPMVISFKGNMDKNPMQVLFVQGEHALYDKKGGVGDVIRDYGNLFKDYEKHFVLPYYNGKIEYDAKGDPTNKVEVLTKKIDGKETPIYTKVDLTKNKVENLKPGQFHVLEEIHSGQMPWTDGETPIKIFQVKNPEPSKPNLPHYMVYTEATAKMPRPYAGSVAYATESKIPVSAKGDPYAQFDKAVVELMPQLAEKKNVKPAHIVLSDAQTSHIAEYMAQQVTDKGNSFFVGAEKKPLITPTFVEHNGEIGYDGATSFSNMFRNYATNEQINLVHKDPDFHKALKNDKTEEYYRKFFPSVPKNNPASAREVIIHHAEEGYVPYMGTVSETYAERLKSQQPRLNKLAELGRYGGILNGFGDPANAPHVPIDPKKLPFYAEKCTDTATGMTHPASKTFKAEMPVKKIQQIRQENAVNFLNRLIENADPKYAAGIEGRPIELLGRIDKKYIKPNVDLFCGVGRGDFQKGHDIAIKAFQKFANMPEGKNAVMVLGGELDKTNPETKIIKGALDNALQDKNIKGRLVFMDGWCPVVHMDRSATAVVYPSRFEPSGLTDYISKQNGATPIVVNVDGYKQKNPDPRIPKEAEKATSYRTYHQYNMSDEELMSLSKRFKEGLYYVGDGKSKKDGLLEQEKKALRIKGTVPDNKLDEVAMERVKKSNAYKKFKRECIDEILVDEIVDAMKAKVTETPELRAKMLKNALNDKTDWHNNGGYRPDGTSAEQAYIKLHLNSKAEAPKKTFFQFTKEQMNEIKTRINEAVVNTEKTIKETADNAVDTAKNITENVTDNAQAAAKDVGSEASKGKGKGILIGLGIAAAIGGVIAYLTLKDKKEDKTKEENPKQIYT